MQSKEKGNASKVRFFLPDSVYNHSHKIRFITPAGQINRQSASDTSPLSLNKKILNFKKDIQKLKLKMSMNKDSAAETEKSEESSRESEEGSSSRSNRFPKSSDCLPFARQTASNVTRNDQSMDREAGRSERASNSIFAKPNVQPRLFFVTPNRPVAPSMNSNQGRIESKGTTSLRPSELGQDNENGHYSKQNNTASVLRNEPKNLYLKQWTNSSKQVPYSSLEIRPRTEGGRTQDETYTYRSDLDRNSSISPKDRTEYVGLQSLNSRSHTIPNVPSTQETRKTVLVHKTSRASDNTVSYGDSVGGLNMTLGEGRDTHIRQAEHLRVDKTRKLHSDTTETTPGYQFFQMKRSPVTYDSGTAYEPSSKLPRLVERSPESDAQKVRLIGKKDLAANADYASKYISTKTSFSAAGDPTLVKNEKGFQRQESPRLIGNWQSSSKVQSINREVDREQFYLQSKTSSSPAQCNCQECISYGLGKNCYPAKSYLAPKVADGLMKKPKSPRFSDDYNPTSRYGLSETMVKDRGSFYEQRPTFHGGRSEHFATGNSLHVLKNIDERSRIYDNVKKTSSLMFFRDYSPNSPHGDIRNEKYNPLTVCINEADDVKFKRKISDKTHDVCVTNSPNRIAEPGSFSSRNQVSPGLIGSNGDGFRTSLLQSPVSSLPKMQKANSDKVRKSHVIVSYYYPKHQRVLQMGDSISHYEGVEYQIYNKSFEVERAMPIEERPDFQQHRICSLPNSAKSIAVGITSPLAGGYEQKVSAVARPTTADSITGSKPTVISRSSVVSETPPIASPSSGSLETEREIDETDSALSVSDSEDDNGRFRSSQPDASQGSAKDWTQKKSGGPRLYRFLLELLEQPDRYPCVQWVNKEERMFKFLDSNHVAKLWGKRKNRPHMKYENFARSLRCYKNRGILRKPRQKLVYQFGEGW
eukprot:gene11534-21757_t